MNEILVEIMEAMKAEYGHNIYGLRVVEIR